MAIDEVLLGIVRSAILRFYRWSTPSVSLGYFAKFTEAREIAGNYAMVRRWTGGGIVSHGDDLTYSIMIGSADGAFALSSKAIYQHVHSALSDALRETGISASLIGTSPMKTSDACFANPVASDVIEGDQKIAGAAHRKTRDGLLHQGSIQRADLSDGFRNDFARALSKQTNSAVISSAVLSAAEELAATKYATESWLHRR